MTSPKELHFRLGHLTRAVRQRTERELGLRPPLQPTPPEAFESQWETTKRRALKQIASAYSVPILIDVTTFGSRKPEYLIGFDKDISKEAADRFKQEWKQYMAQERYVIHQSGTLTEYLHRMLGAW